MTSVLNTLCSMPFKDQMAIAETLEKAGEIDQAFTAYSIIDSSLCHQSACDITLGVPTLLQRVQCVLKMISLIPSEACRMPLVIEKLEMASLETESIDAESRNDYLREAARLCFKAHEIMRHWKDKPAFDIYGLGVRYLEGIV